MKLKDKIKKQIASFMLATGKVEKNALNQDGEELENPNVGHFQKLNQGQLSDALERGEVTQEVQQLRWRYYKTLKEADKYKANVNFEVDENGFYKGVETEKVHKDDKKTERKRVKLEPSDEYELDILFDNKEVGLDDNFGFIGEKEKNIDDGLSHEEITRTMIPLHVERDITPKFDIEKYTHYLYVRDIDGQNKLLEFFVPSYKDPYYKLRNLFVNEIKKAIKNPRLCNFLDIDKVGFITNKTIGADDHKEYSYIVHEFDKIVEYGGHYVIKFKGEIETNGEDVFEKYKDEELEKKYLNKERRD